MLDGLCAKRKVDERSTFDEIRAAACGCEPNRSRRRASGAVSGVADPPQILDWRSD
jgi:hypothetical protein